MQWVTADGVFADAAEVKSTVVFHGVCNLRVAVRRAVLEVLDHACLQVEAEHE